MVLNKTNKLIKRSLLKHPWLNVFLEIAYNYSMRQFLTSGPGKTHEKKTGDPNLGQTGKTFFTIFSSLVYYFSYKLHRMIAWNSRGKTHEKDFWGPKLGPKLGFSSFSQVFIISFPWYCTGLQLGTMCHI